MNTLNKALLLILIVLLLTSPIILGGTKPIQNAPVIVAQEKPVVTEPETIESVVVKPVDPRTKILAAYFNKYNSPLEPEAPHFIEAADTYGVDWKLVPSIAGVESTFGKRIPGGYNAWGWGVYGDQALGFGSWRDGIFTVTGGLKQNYIDKGLTEPLAMNRVYAASPTWGVRVNYFMNDLDQFAKEYEEDNAKLVEFVEISGSSAEIATN